MKKITNWRKATVADMESDNLLRDITKIHVLSFQMQGKPIHSIKGSNHERIKDFFNYHIENNIPIAGHNFTSFDIPAFSLLLEMDLSSLMVIDTLALSWYLNFDRKQHGLGTFHEEYGIEKPPIDDWENLTYEEYKHRCEEDIKINKALWEDFKSRLEEMYTLSKKEIDDGNVGGNRVSPDEEIYLDSKLGLSVDEWVDEILTFLMFKMDCARLQEVTGWDVDTNLLEDSIKTLEEVCESSKATLESVMPENPIYGPRSKPKRMYKKAGGLSSYGEDWVKFCKQLEDKELDDKGNQIVIPTNNEDQVKVIKGYEPPNANSTAQIKSFLFSKGWEPISFKFKRDDDAMEAWVKNKPKRGSPSSDWDYWKATKPESRAIPQISVDGDSGKELCPSVEELAEDIPEIKLYSEFCVAKHRLGILNGFKRDMYKGKLQARIKGMTNTLRVQHAEIVNLPGVDKPYGDIVRGVLIAPEGYILCGSDLSGLEDRVKHHFMLPYDPDYVSNMMDPDYDAHITTAYSAGMITKQEFEDFKNGIKPDHVVKARKVGKSTNYASVYGAMPPTIARTAKISLKEAEIAHKGYWDLNWSVKAIADEQVVITTSRGEKWLVNPINGFCYSLRADKDRFSTLIQGTGAFFFDMWVDNILKMQEDTFGAKTMTFQAHDENVYCIKNSPKAINWFKDCIKTSLGQVNIKYKLRRELGHDTQVGHRYSDIH